MHHPPLVTIGAEGSQSDCDGVSPKMSARWVSRGGGVVRHGSGTLELALLVPVAPPSRGTGWLSCGLHDAAIAALRSVSVAAWTRDDSPGVFTQQGQLGVFGMTVCEGVSRYGLSLYLTQPADGAPIPRGSRTGEPMTTLARLRNGPPPIAAFRQRLIEAVVASLGLGQTIVTTGHEQLARGRRDSPL